MAFKKKHRGPRLPVPKERAPRGLSRSAPLATPPGITPGPNDFSAAEEQSMRRGAAAARMAGPGPSPLASGDEGGEPIPS